MTATLDAVVLQFDAPRVLPEARAALDTGQPVVISLTGSAAQRAATVFLGSQYFLYDAVRTVLSPGSLTVVLAYSGLSTLARLIALGRLRGRRVDVQYLEETHEFRLGLVPPPA
jgi:hypothetical protein